MITQIMHSVETLGWKLNRKPTKNLTSIETIYKGNDDNNSEY